MPGASPGGVLAIGRELERRHQIAGTDWIRTPQGNTPDELEAQRWASENGVPVVAQGRPDSIIMARDLTQTAFPLLSDAERLWDDMTELYTPSLWQTATDFLRHLQVPRQVMWLNTGHWEVVMTLAAQQAANAPAGQDLPHLESAPPEDVPRPQDPGDNTLLLTYAGPQPRPSYLHAPVPT